VLVAGTAVWALVVVVRVLGRTNRAQTAPMPPAESPAATPATSPPAVVGATYLATEANPLFAAPGDRGAGALPAAASGAWTPAEAEALEVRALAAVMAVVPPPVSAAVAAVVLEAEPEAPLTSPRAGGGTRYSLIHQALARSRVERDLGRHGVQLRPREAGREARRQEAIQLALSQPPPQPAPTAESVESNV
jgi:hypothetical protein